MGITTEDFEKKEVQDIMQLIKSKPRTNFSAVEALIKVLVSNGTLTAAQVKRALGKAD